MGETPLNMPEFVKNSQSYYDEIKSDLEISHKGEYVAIDFNSKKYWLGNSASEALVAAKAEFPEKLFYLMQIGSLSAFSIQSILPGDDSNTSYGYQWSY